ncbi:MAG: hypothetical protein ABFD18_06140 [Syntrophomonas sp.]
MRMEEGGIMLNGFSKKDVCEAFRDAIRMALFFSAIYIGFTSF